MFTKLSLRLFTVPAVTSSRISSRILNHLPLLFISNFHTRDNKKTSHTDTKLGSNVINYKSAERKHFSISLRSNSRSQERLGNYSHLFYFGMNSQHLAQGSQCPPLQNEKLRIYSMRFCPFAQRAVLVALAKDIPHDVVNCDLKQKPEWLLERNPLGKVPVLEFPNGAILYESLIVSEFLDEVYKNRPLTSIDPYRKALDKMWIEKFSRGISLFYRIIGAIRSEDTEALQEHLNKFQTLAQSFDEELSKRQTKFFGGSLPGMLDYMIWPWIERLPAIDLFLPKEFSITSNIKKNNPAIENWRQSSMKKDPAIKEFLLPTEIHKQFMQTFIDGSPKYDILDEAKL